MTRAAKLSRFVLLSSFVVVPSVVVGGACNSHPIKPVTLKAQEVKDVKLQLDVNRDVDILFVIDNSGSMGEEQGLLASNFKNFIDVLERPDVKANYRIGITTTDMGRNLYGWCPQSGPMVRGNQGSFMLTSCLDRLDNDFLRSGGTEGDLDRRYAACEKECQYTTAELNIQATTTERDAEAKARPWLQNIEGKTNLAEGISMAEAFACFGPTGIKGCGFEMQLESHARALEKTEDPERPEYGFNRSGSLLAIVHVTDEADCSAAKENIFDPDGDQVFWNVDGTPTSYICWTAGVECTSDGWCDPVDRNGTGATTDDASQAVLHPLNRYINQLENIEKKKKTVNNRNEIIVASIAGVMGNGKDYQVVYPNVSQTDAAFHNKFGIGKGCSLTVEVPVDPNGGGGGGDDGMMGDGETGGGDMGDGGMDDGGMGDGGGTDGGETGGTGGFMGGGATETQEQFAIPPVRLRQFTDHFTPNSMFSICQDDYTPALEGIADKILEQIRPACYGNCVKDGDANTPDVLDGIVCNVTEEVGETSSKLVQCEKEGTGQTNPETGKENQRYVYDSTNNNYKVPEGHNTCFVYLVDKDGMATPWDDHDNMTEYINPKTSTDESCYTEGYNLEFKIQRREGTEAPAGARINASCILSEFASEDCPDLVG